MNQGLARVAAEVHADWVIHRRHAASAKLGHHLLLAPNTDENRIAPWDGAAAGGGEGGGWGVGRSGSGGGGAGRSYTVRCWPAGRLTRIGSRGVAGTAARGPPPSLREDMRLNSSRIGHLAFSAATCTHSMSAVFFASRRW